MRNKWPLLLTLVFATLGACGRADDPPEEPRQSMGLSFPEFRRVTLGGRLFDMWYEEIDAEFVPDDPDTPEIDGRGGPNGNGTLNGFDGKPIANTGHDYRLKNLFGWDMRGAAGIYGASYQAKPWVLPSGPLSPQLAGVSRDMWIARVTKGISAPFQLPAYGDVLSPPEIAAVVDFMMAVRDGPLPRPEDLYSLSLSSPMGYALAPGGDPQRGHQIYSGECAGCHGIDGTGIIFDDGAQSLGQRARYYGYVVAMISLSGEPGSEMGGSMFLNISKDWQVKALLDVLAALCDRERYPRGAGTDPEVPEGDKRCGAYLK